MKIGNHFYNSNWIVANCRYDVPLGMPWHVTFNPSIDYKKKVVSVGREFLSEVEARNNMIEVTNLSVKKLKNMCRKKKAEIEGFQLVPNIPAEWGKQ